MNQATEAQVVDVEWLKVVPQHWEKWRLKFLFRFVGGGTPSKENIGFWTGDIPWISPKDMKSDVIVDTEDHISDDAVAQSATNLVPKGTLLVVTRSGILRHTIPVAITSVDATLNQDLKALLPRSKKVSSEYYAWFIRGLQDQLMSVWRKQGATVESLETDWMADTTVPVPPLAEQLIIVDYLTEKLRESDAIIESVAGPRWRENIQTRAVGGTLGLLIERRSAIIAAAVMGQLTPASLTTGQV